MQVKSPRTLPLNGLHVPKVQADQEADSNGLFENWPGHNCHKNGRCIKKKKSAIWKKKENGLIFCIVSIR